MISAAPARPGRAVQGHRDAQGGQGGHPPAPAPVRPEVDHGGLPQALEASRHPAGQAEDPQLPGCRRQEGQIPDVVDPPEALGMPAHGGHSPLAVVTEEPDQGYIEAEQGQGQPPSKPSQQHRRGHSPGPDGGHPEQSHHRLAGVAQADATPWA